MSLTPALQVNFDGLGLEPDDDYRLDDAGVGHFHKIKAGSSLVFDLKFTGTDTAALTWEMDIRRAVGEEDTLLSTGSSGDAQIMVTTNPTGTDPERVRFSVSSEGTKLLQANGQPIAFVHDIFVIQGGQRDQWVQGSGSASTAVTR